VFTVGLRYRVGMSHIQCVEDSGQDGGRRWWEEEFEMLREVAIVT